MAWAMQAFWEVSEDQGHIYQVESNQQRVSRIPRDSTGLHVTEITIRTTHHDTEDTNLCTNNGESVRGRAILAEYLVPRARFKKHIN